MFLLKYQTHSQSLVTRQTLALPRAGVALCFVRVNSHGVTVTRFALHSGVSPVVGLTQVALSPSKAWPAVTLASEQVTLLASRAYRIRASESEI